MTAAAKLPAIPVPRDLVKPGPWPELVVIENRQAFIDRRPVTIGKHAISVDGQIMGDVWRWLLGERVKVLEVTR